MRRLPALSCPDLYMKSFTVFYSALSVSCLLAGSAMASTLFGSIGGTSTGGALNANLTTTGTLDWALWNDTDGTSIGSAAPVNWKSGDPLGLKNVNITPIAVNGQPSSAFVRGSSLTTTTTFSYTDGASPASASGATPGMVFNADLAFAGAGVQLQIKGDPTHLLQLDIWAGGFSSTGSLTLTLPGTAPLTLTSQPYSGTTPKDATLYTVFYQPDSASDLLTLAYTVTAPSTNGHVGFQAISISTVPEPATGTLLLGTLAFCGFSRRRRATST